MANTKRKAKSKAVAVKDQPKKKFFTYDNSYPSGSKFTNWYLQQLAYGILIVLVMGIVGKLIDQPEVVFKFLGL